MASLNELVTGLNNAVRAIASVNKTLANLFPTADGSTSATATAGAGTLPATPEKFLIITVDGTTYKVPLYKP